MVTKIRRLHIVEFIYFGEHGPSASPDYAQGGGRCYI